MQEQQRPPDPLVGRVVQVSTGAGGVPKYAVAQAFVNRLGLDGDRHREPEPVHGGAEQAVCLYATEAIARVVADGNTAFPGAFGENLTTEGIEIGLLAPGTRLVVGDDGLLLEITKHAAPCSTQQHYFPDGRFARISGKTHPQDARQYARVLVEGVVKPGDLVTVVPDGVTGVEAPAT